MSDLQDLQARHRGEVKELTAKITALRKSIGKGAADKKKKQEINLEISQMQDELKSRHDLELSDHLRSNARQQDAVESLHDLPNDNKKGSRQQKRREKKAMEMKQAYEEAKQEASQCINYKEVEESDISNQLKSLNLKIKEIQPDGHCMYSAIAHQLGQDLTFKEIRSLAANYLRNHSSDFMPFMIDDSGEMSLEQFMDYCQKLEFTAEWGGQIELQAISNSLKRAIHIVQMGSSVIKIGDDFNDKPPILLSYHRHAYGLGEHYNSLIE